MLSVCWSCCYILMIWSVTTPSLPPLPCLCPGITCNLLRFHNTSFAHSQYCSAELWKLLRLTLLWWPTLTVNINLPSRPVCWFHSLLDSEDRWTLNTVLTQARTPEKIVMKMENIGLDLLVASHAEMNWCKQYFQFFITFLSQLGW